MNATLKKLRYKPGIRVAVIGAPAGFEADLKAAKDIARAKTLGKDLDLVQAFFTRKTELSRGLTKLRAALGPKGILWLCYPKGKALGTDLNRDVIRELVTARGLDTVALVAIDDVWSALRCKKVD